MHTALHSIGEILRPKRKYVKIFGLKEENLKTVKKLTENIKIRKKIYAIGLSHNQE